MSLVEREEKRERKQERAREVLMSKVWTDKIWKTMLLSHAARLGFYMTHTHAPTNTVCH